MTRMKDENGNEIICYNSVYRHGVDDKRRVQIPSKWRPAESDTELTLILWSNPPQSYPCLRVYPPRQLKALMDRLEAMSSSDPEAVALRRRIARNSDQVTVDKAGRVTIPEIMAKKAGIDKDSVLAGAMQWFEIWNPEGYDKIVDADEVLAPEALKNI